MSAAAKRAWGNPRKKARRVIAIRNAYRRKRGLPEFPLPDWVPRDLIEYFWEVATESGEEEAASAVRRLKQEKAG